MSPRNILIQIASLAVWVIVTYSDSVVDNEMRACFLEFQEIAMPSMQKVYPEIACWCSCELPSASLYPSIPSWFLCLGSSHVSSPPLPSTNLVSFVPFRYLITLLTTSQWHILSSPWIVQGTTPHKPCLAMCQWSHTWVIWLLHSKVCAPFLWSPVDLRVTVIWLAYVWDLLGLTMA